MTILMASYGRLPLLREAVDSALAQDYSAYEILIIDDGSDEQTRYWLRCAEQQHAARVRVVFAEHAGVAAARARGITEARGELICILDSDDTLVPDALTHMAQLFQAQPLAVIAYSNIRELRPGGTGVVQRYPRYASSQRMLWATLLRPRVPFKHSGTTYRREVALALGSYDCTLPRKIDIDLYLRFLAAGHHPQLIDEPLVCFRMHKDSISIDRILGLRVWFHLIDRYGPRNRLTRAALKLIRGAAELLKRFYVEIVG